MKSKCSICGCTTNFTDEFDIPVISVPADLHRYTNITYRKYELCHNCYQRYKSFDNALNYRYYQLSTFYYKLKNKLQGRGVIK